MPKMVISSSRVYYNELSCDNSLTVPHDIVFYQSMFHKAHRVAYLH